MKLCSNMTCFLDDYTVKESLNYFAKHFDGIDFRGKWLLNGEKEYFLDLKKYANDLGLNFTLAHAVVPSTYALEDKAKNRFNELVQSIKNASYLGIPIVVVHPCNYVDYTSEVHDELFEYNLNFYGKIKEVAKDYNIKIAIENLCTVMKNSITSSAEKLGGLIDALNDNTFCACFDVGHSALCGHAPEEEILKLGDRIGVLHIHDNDLSTDKHTLPFYGALNFEKIMESLAKIDYKGNVSYEATMFAKNLPKALKPDALTYMAKVGRYLIDRFEFYKSK